MAWEIILPIILAIIGSNGVFALIQFFVSRKDNKSNSMKDINDRLGNLEKKAKVAEVDNCRTQLLLLISNYGKDKSEILRLAEHYFNHLKGDWYMTDIFSAWMEANNVKVPEWFKGE